MPGGKTKFADAWLTLTDENGQQVSEWCQKGKNEFYGYCTFCRVDIKCDNSGKQQILQHATKKKHIESTKFATDKKQSKLLFTKSTTQESSCGSANTKLATINYDDKCLEAEILWLCKVACNNFSLRSVDHIGNTFRQMFPDSKIAAEFSLSHTSASYMIGEGLAPHFVQLLVLEIKKSHLPFVMHFDETTSSQVRKQMDLSLRFWSPTYNEVWTSFYTSLFFGHADGITVSESMYKKLVSDGVPVESMLTLVRDGPNVNKTIFRKMDGLIKHDHEEFKGLIDLGSCVIHVVHNSFGKGLEFYCEDVQKMCLDLHKLFQHSAARREDYKLVQFELELDDNNFVQHTEVRWLTLGPAVVRVLEQWDGICKFIIDLGKDTKSMPKSVNFQRLNNLLGTRQKRLTKVKLEFLKNLTPVFEKFMLMFQKCSPVIHILYDSMCDMLMKLMKRFVKPSCLRDRYGAGLGSVDCKRVKNQLSDKELALGSDTRKALDVLSSDEQRQVLLGIRSFLSQTATYLQQKLPLGINILFLY